MKYSTHTSIHTRQPFRRRYNVFISGTHTLTLVNVVSGPLLLFFFFVHTIDYTQYNTQSVQIQTQHAPALDRSDNKLIFYLLPHSHDIILYVLKQQMLLDGIVVAFLVNGSE